MRVLRGRQRQVVQVERNARKLVTLRMAQVLSGAVVGAVEQGAIVWLEPEEGSTDAELREAARALKAAGVAVVKVQPRAVAVKVVGSETKVEPRSGPRQVVEQLVEEARTADRDALSAVVQGVLARVGL